MRLMGSVVDVPPSRIEAVSPACVNVTAVAFRRFVPVICIPLVAPGGTVTGSTLVTAGMAGTVNDCGLVAVPFVLVTVMEPVVAALGTVTTSVFAVADVTVAAVPLNWTVLFAGVGRSHNPGSSLASWRVHCLGPRDRFRCRSRVG